MRTGPLLASACMPDRPVFHPDLAAFFAGLRAEREWGQREAADIAQRRGLKSITRQVLLRLEKGKTKWPDPAVLRELASLYDHDYEDMVNAVVAHTYQVTRRGVGREAVELSTVHDGSSEFVPIARMEGRIAAGEPLAVNDFEILDYLAFPQEVLDQLGVRREFARCVRVGHNEMSMFSTIKPGDTVLLDCSPMHRNRPEDGRIYAVNVDDGSTLKRVVSVVDGLMLHSDNLDKSRYPIKTISFDDDTEMPARIVGRAVWAGGSLL